MDRQAMTQLAERIARAPNNEARVQELVNLAPDAMLSRIGLAHRSSMLGTALTFTGVFVVGAAIGAGAALLFAPTTGQELQTKIKKQGRRLSRDVKKATDSVEERVAEVRDQVSSFTSSDHNSHGKRHGAHA
jgi:hypothetical protein